MTRWAPLLLVLAVGVAYAASAFAPFVYDDIQAIQDNLTIRSLTDWRGILLPQADGGLTVSGRPILNLTLAFSYALSGRAPWGFHLGNMTFHAGAALLLWSVLRRALRSPVLGGRFAGSADAVATMSALLWALHPLQTQAVTYAVQRAESQMGFFYLLTLYAFCRAAESGAKRWLGLSVIAALLGIGTKEVVASAPLLVLLYDRTFVSGSWRAAWRARGGYYLLLAGTTWLALAGLLASTGGNRGGTVGLGVGLPLWAYPLTQFQALARYLGLAVWPSPLVFEYGTWWVERPGDIVPYALVVLPLLGATLYALWRRPVWGFLGAWFFGILAPTSLAPGTMQMIVEHRMYLPLAAVIVAGVVGAHTFAGRRGLGTLAIGAVALLGVTTARNWLYNDRLALWQDALAKRPFNSRAHDGIADVYAEGGNFEAALAHRREALRLHPEDANYHYNLATTLVAAGKLKESIPHYQLSLRLAPAGSRAHNNYAFVLGATGDAEGSVQHYAEAVRLDPNIPRYRYNLGLALLRVGRAAEAVTTFEAVLRLDPQHDDARFNLGVALLRAGRAQEALPHYRAALAAKPAARDYRTAYASALLALKQPAEALPEFQRVVAEGDENGDAYFGVASALEALGRRPEAIAAFQALLARWPDHANAHFQLGGILLDVNRPAEALPHYEAAVRLQPDDPEAHMNLGVVHARLQRWPDALRAFETAVRLRPNYPEAQQNLAKLRTLLREGR